MVLSDKKFIEFSEQVWERNKELLAEKRELLAEVRRLKDVVDDRSGLIERLENENRALRRDLEEVNSRCNEVMDKQYERIRELERKRVDCDEFEDILDDWDDIFEDDLGPSDRFINCTFNLNFK